jgi:hypothetical protein
MKAGSNPRRAHDRRDAGPLCRHHRELDIVQLEGRVLHIDKGRIEAGEPDQLDDLRVRNAADVGSQGETALAQNALDPVLSHVPALSSRLRGPRTPQAGDDHVGIHDIAKRIVEGRQ